MSKRGLAVLMAAGLLALAGCGESEKVIDGNVVNVTTGSRPEETVSEQESVPALWSSRRRQLPPGAMCL